METPDQIKTFLKKHPWAWALLFGFFLGAAAPSFFLMARIDLLKDQLAASEKVAAKCEQELDDLAARRALGTAALPSANPNSGYVLAASVRPTSEPEIRAGVTVQMRSKGMIRHRDDFQADGAPLVEGSRLKVLRVVGEWLEVEGLENDWR
ncbi:MAG: hypothetical protein K0U98_03680 [Deltaproteobacteria bacterium]|nr:hypothetical protein [Deltaproteobacteria bacterium]